MTACDTQPRPAWGGGHVGGGDGGSCRTPIEVYASLRVSSHDIASHSLPDCVVVLSMSLKHHHTNATHHTSTPTCHPHLPSVTSNTDPAVITTPHHHHHSLQSSPPLTTTTIPCSHHHPSPPPPPFPAVITTPHHHHHSLQSSPPLTTTTTTIPCSHHHPSPPSHCLGHHTPSAHHPLRQPTVSTMLALPWPRRTSFPSNAS